MDYDIKNLDDVIINQLDTLYKTNNIPNIIFHGENLTGKKTYLNYLLNKTYKLSTNLNKYILTINCSHGKGNIKFIRENLKFFANTIISSEFSFKSIILLNADKLTIDAQTALRRCIEIYNHSSRFFIIVDNKDKIIKPILSRFSCIYCNKKICYLLKYDKINNNNYDFTAKKLMYLNKYIDVDLINKDNSLTLNDKIIHIINLSDKLYYNGYSGNIIIEYIKNKLPDNENKYKFLMLIETFKKELKNEVSIIFFCLNFIYLSYNKPIELDLINLI
jgi:hypothetical protein